MHAAGAAQRNGLALTNVELSAAVDLVRQSRAEPVGVSVAVEQLSAQVRHSLPLPHALVRYLPKTSDEEYGQHRLAAQHLLTS